MKPQSPEPGSAALGSRHDGTHRRITRGDRLGAGQSRPGGRRLRQRPVPRGAAGVVRAIPACRYRPGRRPRGGHGPAALGRRSQRLPSRRVDHVGLPQARHRRSDGQATDGPRPRPAHRSANRRRGSVLHLARLPLPACFHVRHRRGMARQPGQPGPACESSAATRRASRRPLSIAPSTKPPHRLALSLEAKCTTPAGRCSPARSRVS